MAKKRMTVLQKLLDFSGINPERLRLRWVSSAEAAEFVHEISEFVEEIRKIGPNPLKGKKAA
jgi:F420-non-reducing hydrogenase iron-sulfur subunit